MRQHVFSPCLSRYSKLWRGKCRFIWKEKTLIKAIENRDTGETATRILQRVRAESSRSISLRHREFDPMFPSLATPLAPNTAPAMNASVVCVWIKGRSRSQFCPPRISVLLSSRYSCIRVFVFKTKCE